MLLKSGYLGYSRGLLGGLGMNHSLPIVSIVVPFFGFTKYIKDPIRYPQKGTTMETIGRLI